jgi:hypothetical protein
MMLTIEPKKQATSYQRRPSASQKRPIPKSCLPTICVETVQIIPQEAQAGPKAFEQISIERTFEVDLIGPSLMKRGIVARSTRANAIAPPWPRVAAGGYASAGPIKYLVISTARLVKRQFKRATLRRLYGSITLT